MSSISLRIPSSVILPTILRPRGLVAVNVRWPDGTVGTFVPDEIGENRRLRLVYPDQLTAW